MWIFSGILKNYYQFLNNFGLWELGTNQSAELQHFFNGFHTLHSQYKILRNVVKELADVICGKTSNPWWKYLLSSWFI